MAEALFRLYAPKGYEPASAGTRPAPGINQVIVQVMKEIGIDISGQSPKILTGEMIRDSVMGVNMGCMGQSGCPTWICKNLIDWNIEDPKGKPIERVREIRDEIRLRVEGLCKTLG